MATHFVRIKPFNPKKGYKVRTYTYGGTKYVEEQGWYQVADDKLAAELRELTQAAYDGESPPLFDVCTRDEALAIEKRERAAKDVRSTVETAAEAAVDRAAKPRPGLERARRLAGTLTTDDLKPEDKERAAAALLGAETDDEAETKPNVVAEVGRLGDEEQPDDAGAEAGAAQPEGRVSSTSGEDVVESSDDDANDEDPPAPARGAPPKKTKPTGRSSRPGR